MLTFYHNSLQCSTKTEKGVDIYHNSRQYITGNRKKMLRFYYKVRMKAMIRNPYNQIPLDPYWKVTKTQKNITYNRANQLVPLNTFKPSSKFLADCFKAGDIASFVYPLLLFVIHFILSCLFLATVWSPTGKGQTIVCDTIFHFTLL